MPVELCYVAHDLFLSDVRTLAKRLAEDSSFAPDFIVGIGRGGLVPGAYLSHAADLPLLSVDYSAGVPGFGTHLLNALAEKTKAGKRLLIVDDINDSGGTIARLRAEIAHAGGVMTHVRVAVLMTNIRSGQLVDYFSREIDRDSDKRWFVFPWEAMARPQALECEAQEVPERLGR